jgi:hypothetical protein
MEHRSERRFSWHVLFGLALITFGVAYLLDNMEIIDVGPFWRFWPLLVVALGLGKIFNAQTNHERGDGVWWLFIGLWLFVSIVHVFGLGFSDTWPMLIIAWGISLLWKSLPQRSHSQTAV